MTLCYICIVTFLNKKQSKKSKEIKNNNCFYLFEVNIIFLIILFELHENQAYDNIIVSFIKAIKIYLIHGLFNIILVKHI